MRVYNGRVYVPVASLEEPESSSFNYHCCSFRGMIAALDAQTGKQIWKTYTIDESPTERKTPDGKSYMGPSGAGVWRRPRIDPKRNAIYLTTGNTFSAPDVGRSDALMAMDLDTGKILWTQQDEAGDVWHTGCPQGRAPAGFPPKNVGNIGGPARPGGAGAFGLGGPGRGASRCSGSEVQAVDVAAAVGRAAVPDTYYCPTKPKTPTGISPPA